MWATHVKLAALLLLFVSGCAGSLPDAQIAGRKERAEKIGLKIGVRPTPSEYCQSLNAQHRTWGGIGKGSAFLAGGAGLGTVAVDDDKTRMGIAIASATMAAISVMSIFFSEDAAVDSARDCSE